MEDDSVKLLRLVALLTGIVIGAFVAALALLVVSLFHDIGVTSAFVVQLFCAIVGGARMFWKSA